MGCRTRELYLLGDLPRTFLECAQVNAEIGKVEASTQVSGFATNQELIVRLLRLGLEPAASAVTVPSGTLHITNLHVDSEFVVVAEVDDVVAAATGASGTS